MANITGTPASETLTGRAGSDPLELSQFHGPSSVEVRLDSGEAINNGNKTGTVVGIENVTGAMVNDTLFGNQQANILQGGDGKDSLSGLSGDDKLNLSALGDLTFVSTPTFSGDGPEVRYLIAGGNTSVRIDLDGDGGSDLNILLQGVGGGIVAGNLIL